MFKHLSNLPNLIFFLL